MILRRLGNKSKIAKEIQKYFPPHKIYIEPFFGAGGMFFNKPLAKYNFLNDIDNEVINLHRVLIDKKDELIDFIINMPIHSTLFQYYKTNKDFNCVEMAARSLFLANFSLNSGCSTMILTQTTDKKSLIENIEKTYNFFIRENYATKFYCGSFDKFIKDIPFHKDGRDSEKYSFIYADPPYVGSRTDTYKGWGDAKNISRFWGGEQLQLLINSCNEKKIKYAISEFNTDEVLQIAEKNNLNVHIIGERKNLKNRRIEILITNYKVAKGLFD